MADPRELALPRRDALMGADHLDGNQPIQIAGICMIGQNLHWGIGMLRALGMPRDRRGEGHNA